MSFVVDIRTRLDIVTDSGDNRRDSLSLCQPHLFIQFLQECPEAGGRATEHSIVAPIVLMDEVFVEGFQLGVFRSRPSWGVGNGCQIVG